MDLSPCAYATVEAYTGLSSTGCSLGIDGRDFVYKNFSYSAIEGGLSAAQLNVTPLTQNGSLNLGLTSPAFSAQAGERKVFTFEYILDPPPPILEDMSMDMEAQSPVAPGFATIEVDICAGGAFVLDVCQYEHRQFTLYHYGDNDLRNVLRDSVRFTPTNIVDVRTTVTLDGGPSGGNGSSQIDGFSYYSTPIPEPGTVLLTGAGIAVAAMFVRRRRQGL